MQNSQAQCRSFLNPDAMLRKDGHVQFEQKFEILYDPGGPLTGNDAVKTVTADVRSLVKAFVEELHGCRTFPRQDGRAKTPGTSIGN
jgi:hypothetical protein